MAGRFVLKIGNHLDDAEKKKYYNEKLFSEVAPRYDFITRVLSFGDVAWKRALISSLPSYESPVCVDLACGTGDISFLLADKYGVAASPNGHHRADAGYRASPQHSSESQFRQPEHGIA